eukprot:Gb_02942 [translate_table: standard]
MARRKGSQLPQVMLLKHIIRGCQRFALFSRKNRYLAFECDEEKASCGLPTDVPKGHIPVYVGSERSRFIIPTTYLNHPLFRALLQKAEDEFGFDHQLGLTIPYEQYLRYRFETGCLRDVSVRHPINPGSHQMPWAARFICHGQDSARA